MTDRKLVTFRKVDKLFAIPKKDRIELALIGGWSCIVKKGEFKVGDIGVYFEIDSFLPNLDSYSFVGKLIEHQDKQGYRLRTMKLGGAISQGLLLPISAFNGDLSEESARVGDDLTELLGVTKYDIDLVVGKGRPQVTGKPSGSFPSFLKKTDQERIQNLPHFFDLHQDTLFEETLKLDGSSCTMYKVEKDNSSIGKLLNTITFGAWFRYINTAHFGVCSRNLELKEPKLGDKQSNFWNVALKYNIHNDLPIGYAIQGEVLAPNIQGNYEKVSEPEFYIFSVFDIKSQEYLPPEEAEWFVELHLSDANYIPIIDRNLNLFQICNGYDRLQLRVDSESMNKKQKVSEGRVYKSKDGKTTFKVINNKYLLQKDK